MELRLSVLLSRASVASRREADKIISEGRVTVNGEVITRPFTRINVGKDHVKVDGKLIKKLAPHVYLVLNKPAGFVTTARDPQERSTVFDLIKRVKVNVEPVGRLDYESEGLLLFTNDGDLARKLTGPKYKVPKSYRVKVRGKPNSETLARLRNGINLDGKKTLPAKVKSLRRTDNYTWLRITIREGKYRQLRRMMKKVGHPVARLIRESVGPLTLVDVKPGRFRYLRQDEIRKLRKAVS